ncbi:MAG: prepilin-type N-terminal cleavage/methylation domain-containing protein [Patescibacteria group bacterium]
MFKTKERGFTLIELLVVIAIIGILATLAVVALQQARSRARDSKRMADMKQVQTALELFFNENGRYPTTEEWNSGTIVSSASQETFMHSIPSAPTPADGDCTSASNAYAYVPSASGDTYTIDFCTGKQVSSLPEGAKQMTPGGIIFGSSEVGGDSLPGVGCLVDSTGCGWASVSSSFSTVNPDFLSFYVENDILYVAYRDSLYSSRATVKKFDGTNWITVGNPGFSDGMSNDVSLFVYNGTPYIAYRDYGNNSKVTVMKFDGSSWVNVGNPGFSAGDGWNVSLYVYDDTPYIAYSNNFNSGKVTTMKFDGSSWVDVGSPLPVAESSFDLLPLSIFIYNGSPYLAYKDNSNNGDISVSMFNGSDWVNVGDLGFSIGSVDSNNLISFFVDNNVPYVAYSDSENNYSIRVMKYDGSSWVVVGDGFFGQYSYVYSRSLFVYQGVPYLAYSSDEYSGLMSVARFKNSNWEFVGNQNFSDEESYWINIFVDNDNAYVAYSGLKTIANVVSYTSCVPDCSGKSCGNDGCGGLCGSCPDFYTCESGVCIPPVCFLSGTKISMADGSYKNIEDVVVGDVVKSYDFTTKSLVSGKVSELIKHSSEKTSSYLIINKNLKVTHNHEILLNGYWKQIGEARIGDYMQLEDGSFRFVDSIEIVYENVPTYNFEVEDYHNYYAEGILVHNALPPGC